MKDASMVDTDLLAPVQDAQGAIVRSEDPLPKSPFEMMIAAQERGIMPDQAEKMLALQERWEANEAKKAYNLAMADFSAEKVTIPKTKRVGFESRSGSTEYSYAPLSVVVSTIGPVLARHGFSWSWTVSQADTLVTVTCTLKHSAGHAESVSISAPSGGIGKMNAVQSIASVITYLRRYSLEAACGISEEGDDDDGQSAADKNYMEHGNEVLAMIEDVEKAKDLATLQKLWSDGVARIGTFDSLALHAQFKAAVQKRTAELTPAKE